MLNEAFDTFLHTAEQADAAPTRPQYDVFRMLSTKLDEQVRIWEQIRTVDLPAVNNLVRESNVPVLTVNAGNAGSTGTITREGMGRAKHIFERQRGKMCQLYDVRA